MKRAFALLMLGMAVWIHFSTGVLWSDEPKAADVKAADDKAPDAKAEEAKPEEKPDTNPKPDPSGGSTGDASVIGTFPEFKPDPKKSDIDQVKTDLKDATTFMKTMADFSGKNRVGINMMWTLLTGFLVMFMQAGFAMVETGLCRYKNVAHTMAMNFMVYAIGMLGFWLLGFGLMFGGYNSEALGGGFLGGNANLLTGEYKLKIGENEFGIFGTEGFLLTGRAYDVGIMALFLFQMVFMDTTATIPTGAMAERWKFFSFVIYGFFVSMIIYPIYGNWVWGGGWLSKLGSMFNIGHGHVDFAGSSVVHMVGGVTALAGALVIGPRIGKFNKDGTVNALPAHSVPMYMIGTFILAFGWFGFNPGSTLAGSDLIIGRVATNTMLASAGGAFSAMIYMWLVYKKPDPSFMCNGMLAGLVAITAPCAFVNAPASVVIGLVSGVLVIWSCVFWEKVVKIDDPVGAVSVHGVNGAWGILALGIFADGTYGQGWNGSHWYKMLDGSLKWFKDAVPAEKFAEMKIDIEQGVTGLLYGNTGQFKAECIGIAANILWVFPVAFVFFWIIELLIGNRVSAAEELGGLDIPEMGVLGYINEDPKSPEGHVVHPSAEPKPALLPRNGQQKFTVVVDGVDTPSLINTWSALCQPNDNPPPAEFLAIYPHMTMCQGNRFRFRGGDPEKTRYNMEILFKSKLKNQPVTVKVDK